MCEQITINLEEEDLYMQLLLRAMWKINHMIKRGADVTVIWEKDKILVIGRKFELRVWFIDGHLKMVWETTKNERVDDMFRIESRYKKVSVEISRDRAEKIMEYIYDLIVSMVYADPSDQDIYLAVRDLIKPLIHKIN
jgi:hypothetical protein